MSLINKTLNKRLSVAGTGVILSVLIIPAALYAQGLEEIVVTAQRREQSLQEVPISITTVNAEEIRALGIRTVEDLDTFSPSVEIQYNLHSPSITIRGMGSNVANMSIEQSAPMFVDGITYGRASMMAAGMLDVERIEVLNGPQPISFGQNATAGAFSITNKKPTAEWEGYVNSDVGNFGRITFDGASGGPINDQWGIRVAGKWDQTSGHLTDAWTGDSFPHRRDAIGRVSLAWTPNEKLQGLLKVSYMERESEGDPSVVCARPDRPLSGQFDETAVILGKIPAWDAVYGPTHGLQVPLPDCVTDGFTNVGWREGRESRPRQTITGYNSADSRSGTMDILDFVRPVMESIGAETSIASREPLNSLDVLLNFTYELDNGIQIASNTGIVDYRRETYEENETDPFVNDSSSRVENFDMWSQELRVRSEEGGTFEWEFGGYYQIEDLDLGPVLTLRPNLSEPLRTYKPWQNPEWKSAFASITYNFLDNKASVDVGGRYTDVHKEGGVTGQSATWIFNIDPRDSGGVVRATSHRDPALGAPTARTIPFATSATSHMTGGAIIDCGQPQFAPVTQIRAGNPSDPRDRVTASGSPCGTYGAGYYTAVWLTRDIPDAWDGQRPVALSPVLNNFSDRPGPFNDTYDTNSFDPQVVLRYRPWENLSVYAKWAKAFKSGGFDTSDRGMAEGGIGFSIGQDGFSYKDEFAENFEIGARGDLFDSRFRYGLTLFNQEVKDLQIEAILIDLAAIQAGEESTGRAQINAGLQRTRGIDFDFTWLVTDGLIAKLSGVYQRGRMLDFIAGCTPEEIANAASNDCLTNEESIALIGTTAAANFIDRAGSQAPRTPDWKVTAGLDYEHALPFWGEQYKYFIGSDVAFSDGFSVNVTSFTRVVAFNNHTIWNMNMGLSSVDDTWKLQVYARNILDEKIEYNPEFDVATAAGAPQAWNIANAGARDYFNYGLQLGYNF